MEPIIIIDYSCEKESESISLGNKHIYDMAREVLENSSNVNYLASLIWVLGRSYAASPERRQYKKGSNNTPSSLSTGSNGTASYFMKLAETIISDNCYDTLIDFIRSNTNTKYNYDNLNGDMAVLENVNTAVNNFNNLLRKSIIIVDCRIRSPNVNDVQNFISFSSKFLHFLLPNIVFIYDSYSQKNAKNYVASNGLMIPNIKSLNSTYGKHIQNAYGISCNLARTIKPFTPRMFDNYILQVKIKP